MLSPRQPRRGHGYPELKPLLDLYLGRVRDRLGESLSAVALYGSVARGQAQAASDVDLFVVHRGRRAAVFKVFLHVALQMREHPLVCELQARKVPTEPYAVFRTETELADTPGSCWTSATTASFCSIRARCWLASWRVCGCANLARAAWSWPTVRGIGT